MATVEGAQVGRGDGHAEIPERNQLRALLKAIIPYLPKPIVDAHLADPELGRVTGEYWEGSVVFADLSGFTALSEVLSKLGKQGAEEITRIVNDLFEALLQDIERYGGILVKFGGDALTVYFGGRDHASRAARAGLALQETMARRFGNMETLGGFFTLRLRVGVHTGRVFAAQVGFEQGVPLRGMELVVSGADVNRVAEAQDFAAPAEVCITGEALAQISGGVDAKQLAEGMFRLDRLSWADFVAPDGSASEYPGLAEWPVPRLRQCVQALGPYLPWDLTEERISDPSDPELRSDLRLVAVLFANFADLSSILAALRDSEAEGVRVATRILNAYYVRMQEVIGRYGGVVNKVDMYTHGDKLMAVFGAPVAHEDDAERAVRAALEMQAIMPAINATVRQIVEEIGVSFTPLAQRIGINFGHVFAGVVGSEREGSRREYTVMGDTVNLAARLMAAASIGDVLISPSMRRRISDRFAIDDLAPIKVKGKSEPIAIARPSRPLTEGERAAARRERRIFIGRAAQLETMQVAAERAVAGNRQVVVILGEAGTGKTRLVEAFRDQLSQLSPSRRLDYYFTGLPSYAQEPYAPIVNLLRRLMELSGETTQDVALLRNWIQVNLSEMERFLPLLGDLLALPIADNPVTSALTLEQRRDRLFDLIEGVLEREARRRPLMLVVDDLQWVDESSLALLERLTEKADLLPLLITLCYRPDVPFSTPWVELPHTRVVRVKEFASRESAHLVAELLATEDVPDGLIELVWTKAQGNPFFIEEFVKALTETEAIVRQGERWQLLVDETAATAIPDTIEGIVLARLDRLGLRYRDVLQEASVAAASQPYIDQSLLKRVDPFPAELSERLQRLVHDSLLEVLESELEDLEYHFRHAVTRDVAYDSLLYARRRELHHLIAQAIEVLYAARLDEHVTSLAHHYLEAERWPEAFSYQRRAGERAQVLFANRNAIRYFRRALSIAEERLPDMLATFESDEFVEALSETHERLGDVLLLEGRYDEALETYEDARSLLTQDSPPENLAKFYRKAAEVYERKGDFPLALEWLERGLQVLGDREVVETARIYNLGGGVYYRQAVREEALTWLQRGLQIAERLEAQREIANAYRTMAVTHAELGDTDRALDVGRQSLEAATAAEDLAAAFRARINLGIISRRADNWVAAVEHYREGLRLGEMMGDVMYIGVLANNMGSVYLDQGKLEQAAAAYQRSISVLEPIGNLNGVVANRINLGKVAVLKGDLEEGEQLLGSALTLAQEIGAGVFLPEIYHWRAVLQLEHRRYPEALELAGKAHDLARELKDRVEEGSALRVLGRIAHAMGQRERAVEHLEASLNVLMELKSTYQVAKTLFRLALVYLDDQDRREEGRGLLAQARTLFAELGAQRDLAQAERVIDQLSRSS